MTPTLLFALLLAALLPSATRATCNVGYSAACSAVEFTVTSNVFFNVNATASNEGESTYNATVTFHWGPEDTTVGPQLYNISEPVGLSSTYQYEKEGYYPVGYTLVFHDENAAGCSGNTYNSIKTTLMERTPSRCEVGAETPVPTGSPTVSMMPSVSSAPTTNEAGRMGGARILRAGLGLAGVAGGLLL
ncbi:hypothetical protein ACHAXT_012321 [Thalassiosira profunda]